MFSKALELTLNLIFTQAREKRHEFITIEHLLLALLDNPEAVEVLISCGTEIEHLRAELAMFIDETTPQLPDSTKQETQPTLGFQRVLQRAVFQVQTAHKAEVTGANVLAAIFGEQESQAVYLLSQSNATQADVLNYISHGISQIQGSAQSQIEPPHAHELDDIPESVIHESALERFAVNLNDRARAGEIDPLIGREEELQRTIQVLCRRHKNNPLFVGEAGVGKTALAEGLARLILENDIPEALEGATIYSLDLGLLLAGTKYRGDFEKRFKTVLKELQQIPDAIVFIDEIHTIIGAGAAAGGAMDASNLIKPLLAKGDIRCMGSTTYQEYRNIFEKDRALTRRFQKIDIPETTTDQTFQILKGLKHRFEEYHGVRYTVPALKSAVELSSRYINDRHLPDKAIDVVDEAGAYQQLQPESKRKKVISRHEIEEIVAKMARIPSQNITTSDKEQLLHLERNLKMLVFGQDEAITSLCSAIKLSRSGLRDIERPVGCFLFAGPTGVGKTEVTQQLAKLLGVELLRFDMSEYMESHTVSRLIGAPPGYVGYDQGGLLTEAINKHPHSVLLMDEIEKAHPDVYNLLLQVMDHGSLTDNNGRNADFRHVVIVMTTNAGAEMMDRNAIGFTNKVEGVDSLEVIKRSFTPEFRNRLDSIILFKHLYDATISCVVDKFITELEVVLLRKGVQLSVEDSARQWLAEHGYDEKMGARPMARLIQEKIKQPLADALLFGKLAQGGSVNITADNGKEMIVNISEKVQT